MWNVDDAFVYHSIKYQGAYNIRCKEIMKGTIMIKLLKTKNFSMTVILKDGSVFQNKDVPEYLRSTMAQPKEYEWDTDDLWFKRWDWVLEQMIWSFEQLQPECDWEDQFHTGVSDIKFVKLDDGSGCSEMVRGPNDTRKWDKKGYIAYQKRISNGLVLFGKYYQNLWD